MREWKECICRTEVEDVREPKVPILDVKMPKVGMGGGESTYYKCLSNKVVKNKGLSLVPLKSK